MATAIIIAIPVPMMYRSSGGWAGAGSGAAGDNGASDTLMAVSAYERQ